jgi:hypothetical protein
LAAQRGLEAVVDMTSQQRHVLQIVSRLSLRVQDALDALDDFVSMGQEGVEEVDVSLERSQPRDCTWFLFPG